MILIDLPTAKAHLRVGDDYPDEQVAPYLNAAELLAAQFMNRNVYADQAALDAAVALVPDALIDAGIAYDAAILVADDVTDLVARAADQAYALTIYTDAQEEALMTRRGIVVNDLIKAGMLLILGHLFESREDTVVGFSVSALPMGSQHLLQPYRVRMGV